MLSFHFILISVTSTHDFSVAQNVLTVSHQRAFSLPITTTSSSITAATTPSNSSNKSIPYSVNMIGGYKSILHNDNNTCKDGVSDHLFSSGESQRTYIADNSSSELVVPLPHDTSSLKNLTKIAHNNCFHFRTRSLPLTEEPFIETFQSIPTLSTSSLSPTTPFSLCLNNDADPCHLNSVMDKKKLSSSTALTNQISSADNDFVIIEKLCGKNRHLIGGVGNHHLLQSKLPYSRGNRYQLSQYQNIDNCTNINRNLRPHSIFVGRVSSNYKLDGKRSENKLPYTKNKSNDFFASDFASSATIKTTTITTTVATIACMPNTVTLGAISSSHLYLSSAIPKSTFKGLVKKKTLS